MTYHIDGSKVDINALKSRIIETDLIPSRACLMDDIDDRFEKLKEISNLDELRKTLKSKKKLEELSETTSIPTAYLDQLRRAIEGYFPKSIPLREFIWIDDKVIAEFVEMGYKNSKVLYDSLDKIKRSDKNSELLDLVNLTRIQWVKQRAAKMLYESGYKTIEDVLVANAEEMCEKMDKTGKEKNLYKGKIGLRDIKRIILAAKYVSKS